MTEKPYDVIDKAEPRGQSVTYGGIPCTARTCVTRLNRLTEENEQLKQKYNNSVMVSARIQTKNDRLKDENEQLKKELFRLKELKFICLDCEHCGLTEMGCLCEDKDCWIEYRTKCDDFKKGEWVDD